MDNNNSTTEDANSVKTPKSSKGNPNCVGVDVSKETLACFCEGNLEETFPNSNQGIERLLQKCKKMDSPFIVCEATGGYEQALVRTAQTAGVDVTIVPPNRVRQLANAHGQFAKTDPLDARLIAQYGREVGGMLMAAPSAVREKLRELMETRHVIKARLVQLQGLKENATELQMNHFRSEETWQKEQLAQIEAQLSALEQAEPSLGADVKRLTAISGVGLVFARTLLAYAPYLRELGAKNLCTYVGVVPFPSRSGNVVKPEHIRGGCKPIRDVLYMCARSAATHNAILKPFYERLKSKGKPDKVCIVAVMRKLLLVMHRLLTKPEFNLA